MFRQGVHKNKAYKKAAFYIKDNYTKGDLLAHSSFCTYEPFFYYLNCNKSGYKLDFSEALLNLPPYKGSHYSDISWFLEHYKKTDIGYNWLRNSLRFNVNNIIPEYRRVWFIFSDWEPEVFDESCLEVKKWLFQNFKIIGSKEFDGIEVYLFDTSKKI